MDRSYPSDVAFSPAVKAEQERRGSRAHYARMEQTRGWRSTVTPELAAFLAERDSVYLATANAAGQPYIQHRGGPKGFLRVIDERTLGFADFRGNRQYVTAGNLAENDRAFIFLMDYAQQQRIKIWGRARIIADDPALTASLAEPGYAGKPEQAILFTIEAWDVNCRQHIPQLLAAADVADAVGRLQSRIAELEAEVARSRAVAETVERS
jgi:predicted pyridoxine 5'-phosphate oxidase superfamily flavin-nucleotide-binding protein